MSKKNKHMLRGTADVMAGAAFSGGDHEESCDFLKEYLCIPGMIPKSQFSWRPARADSLKIYIADSFPVPACRNIRMKRCKIYNDECFKEDILPVGGNIFKG